MKLEVMLSVMNLKKKELEHFHITSKCTVINQCQKNDFETYKNFNIYSYEEKGASNSRNKGLEKVKEDIILICDDDVVYQDQYEELVLKEFHKRQDADIIIFNIESPNRKIKKNKKEKKLHIYNILRYSSQRIAFRRKSIKKIKFNTMFGPNAKYGSGEDTLFLVDCIKNGLNIYSSTQNIGTVFHEKSSWFQGYNEKYFFDKGALFTAISYPFRHFLMLQYLIRHKDVLENLKFRKAYRLMLDGSKDYRNLGVEK